MPPWLRLELARFKSTKWLMMGVMLNHVHAGITRLGQRLEWTSDEQQAGPSKSQKSRGTVSIAGTADGLGTLAPQRTLPACHIQFIEIPMKGP